MKFKQKLERSISLRFSADRKKKCKISRNMRTNKLSGNLRPDNCSDETEAGCNLDHFEETLNNFDKTETFHSDIHNRNVINEYKDHSTSKSTFFQDVKNDMLEHNNRYELPSKTLHKSEHFPLRIISTSSNCSQYDNIQANIERSKRNVFKRSFSKSKRKTGFLKRISSSKPRAKLTEKSLPPNLKSHILLNMTEIADLSKCTIRQISSQEKPLSWKESNHCSAGGIQRKQCKENASKKLNLHLDLENRKPVLHVPKTQGQGFDSESQSFKVTEDLSPTCADIYGIDEVDNISFEKLITERDFVHNLVPKADCRDKDIQSFAESVEGNKTNEMVFINVQNSVEARNGTGERDGKKTIECTQTDIPHVKKSADDACMKKLSTSELQEKELSKISSLWRTSSQSQDLKSSKEHELYENPWVLQDSHEKSLQQSLKMPDIEIESSLGFEDNYCLEDSALVRNDSTDSLDSFGSSYHSVSSMKDVYFSDSEAEHNIDEILDDLAEHKAEQNISESVLCDLSEQTVETSGNQMSKISTDVDKTPHQTNTKQSRGARIPKESVHIDKDVKSLSDLDSDQKQMIPYAFAKTLDSNLTVRKKKKKYHSRSFDEKLDRSFTETPEKHTGEKKSRLMKSLSHGFSGENESKHHEKSKHYRRSLDSSLSHRNILNEIQTHEKRRSALNCSAEFLSPVLESDVKVSKRDKEGNGQPDNKLDPTRYFTLPNPKKLKSQQSNLKRRLGSVSKLISDKAQSLSNLKMGASFKLRKEIEKSKTLVSSSATSLSDLMTKKASSFSTLIRRRTNSNTAVESPFKQYTRKVSRVKEENKTELVYEKVRVKVPAKRPITDLEQTARSKRLRVSLKLAKNSSKSESQKYDDETRSRTNSFIGKPWSSGSLSPVRSPTLLDEIMKCVDTARVRHQCSVTNDEFEPSDCEESSSGSSLFLFQKQYSLDSDTKDIAFMTVCRVCGKIRNASDRSSDSSDSSVMKRNSGLFRISLSLCDLNTTCQCFKSDQTCRHRFSGLLSFTNTGEQKALVHANRRSWDIISDFKGNVSDEIKSGNVFRKDRMLLTSTQRPSSMYDLRDDLDETKEKVEFEMGETESRYSIGSSEALPGILLRHRPLLDLSGENLDITADSEDGAIDDKGDSYAQRSQSCGDLIDSGRYFESEITIKDLVKMRDNNETEADSESFHSCSETVETETDVNDFENETQTEKQKSHSCSNLFDEKDAKIGDKLKEDEQRKKELRKVKVKSMSSSHDALSILLPIDTINIDEYDNPMVTKQNNEEDIENASKERENGQSIVNDIIELTKNGLDIESKVNKQKSNNAIIIANGIKTSLEKLGDDEDDKENLVCEKCNCLRNKADETKFLTKDGVKTMTSGYVTPCKILSKPPIPRKRQQTKVLSLSDISNQDNKDSQSFRKQKGYSMIELDKENITVSLCKCDIGVKDKKGINKHITLLDRSESRTTPKSALLKIPFSKFMFDDHQVFNYLKAMSKFDRQKSISSDNVSIDSPRNSGSKKLLSACSLNRLSKESWSDEVFNRLAYPLSPQLSPYIEFFESTPLKGFSRFSGARVTSPGLLPELPELPSLTEECVYKYDVCLGYLLHSVQCDNMMICVYSLQRNKQLMESVITPLTASPQTPRRKPQEHGSVNKNKAQYKTKLDDLPNPAAPITSVPSDRLVHAGLVLRTVLLARAPHMIRDRKFHLRTYRRCMVGTEMVDWLLQQSALVHSRTQAVGMWQALVEEGVVVHVCHEHQFKDKYLFYRFHEDDEGVSTVPSSATKRECEEDLPDVFLMLAHIGPDAMMRMILRKPPHERTSEDLEIIYEELLHIKALSHLSTMVKRELASVLLFESHAKSGTVLFNQGDEGKSWYIILKGSVNVVIYGKGVVCTLHEGDDFGKLALVNDAPRAATIVLRDDNCHFLRVDKDDFNRILRDVEANTVRLKEHGQDVLVLEKIPSNTQTADGSVQAHYKYSVMAGTPDKMLEHLLDSRLDNKNETEIDGFLEDFLLTHVIFMPCNHLCPVLLSHYHSSSADSTEQEGFEFMLNHKKCVLHFVQEWANIVGVAFREDHTINAFLEELHSCVQDDLKDYPTLKNDFATLETIFSTRSGSPNSKQKKRVSGSFKLSRKHSKECFQDSPRKRKPVNPSEEAIFKVYCADHTYSTLKLPMDTKVEHLLLSTKEKLGLGDDLILCEVKSTGERIIFKENDLCVTTGLSINGRLFVTPKEHLDALTPLPEQEGISDGSFSTIEMFSSREMAYHMTLYDWELFTCVQEYELIYLVFGRYKFGKVTANLDLFLRRFNEIQFWVVTEMVLTNNLSKRVSLLRKLIKLAAHCKEFKNLNSFFAIVMGLSNIAVSRLSQTWEKLPSKFKKMFEDFETLMDPSRNHRVYRLSVAKMSPPILPFMPLLMKDMTFTHEGNKTYFDGLVNFEKMHMIAQTLKTVRFCRSAHLDLEAPGTLKSSDTSQYIRSLKVIDNQRRLTQLSHKLEPRKT